MSFAPFYCHAEDLLEKVKSGWSKVADSASTIRQFDYKVVRTRPGSNVSGTEINRVKIQDGKIFFSTAYDAVAAEPMGEISMLRIFNSRYTAIASAPEFISLFDDKSQWKMSQLEKSDDGDSVLRKSDNFLSSGGVQFSSSLGLAFFDFEADYIQVEKWPENVNDDSVFEIRYTVDPNKVDDKRFNCKWLKNGTLELDPLQNYLPIRSTMHDIHGNVIVERFSYQSNNGALYIEGIDSKFFSSLQDMQANKDPIHSILKMERLSNEPVPDRIFDLLTYGLVEPVEPASSLFRPWNFIVLGVLAVGIGIFMQKRGASK